MSPPSFGYGVSVSQMTTDQCSVFRNHCPALSLYMTCHWVCKRLTRQVSLVLQELPTFPEHLSSLPQVFFGVHVAQDFFLCVVYCRPLFMKRKFKQWWRTMSSISTKRTMASKQWRSTILPISTNRKITFHHNSLNTK